MTPMVDLGFLLITFFIFTTALKQPSVTKLIMPKSSKDSVEVTAKFLLTAVLDKDKVFVYEGVLDNAAGLHPTTYNVQSGLGSLIRQKREQLLTDQKEKLMVMIKPMPSASYQDVINALDEMQINKVTHYAIVDASNQEKTYVAIK